MDTGIIDAVCSGDRDRLRSLLADGVPTDARDEHGWTPLHHAAGRGDAVMVRLLIEHGADPTLTGRDLRTPLRIAKAAERAEVVEILVSEEKQQGVWRDSRETRLYCKAYLLSELRRFPDWSEPTTEGTEPLVDDTVVYVHQDFTVTRSMWHGEDVVLGSDSPAWREFCEGELGFAIPPDLR